MYVLVCVWIAVTAHLNGMYSAVKMLNDRLHILQYVLTEIKNNTVDFDHSFVRQVASLTNRLPIIDSDEFRKNFMTVRLRIFRFRMSTVFLCFSDSLNIPKTIDQKGKGSEVSYLCPSTDNNYY